MYLDVEIAEDAREQRLAEGGNTQWTTHFCDRWFVCLGKIPQSVLGLGAVHTGVQLRSRQNCRYLCRIVNRIKHTHRGVVGSHDNSSDTDCGK